MPVIIIGADTSLGASVVDALRVREGELRAFVTDPDMAEQLRSQGIKTALGDVSDASHVAGACWGAFSAVICPEAARDQRERSFLTEPDQVAAAWIQALAEAQVTRLVWLEDDEVEPPAQPPLPQVATVATGGRDRAQIAAEVARLDETASLDEV